MQLLVVDLEGNEEALTLTPRNINAVKWSPDGTRVVFASLREGSDGADLFVKTLDDDVPARLGRLGKCGRRRRLHGCPHPARPDAGGAPQRLPLHR